MAVKVNLDSVRALCGESSQIMVYGYEHCLYEELKGALVVDGSPIKRVFDYTIGKPNSLNALERTTVEGRAIAQIRTSPNHARTLDDMRRPCKDALVNIVFENYLRRKSGLPPIITLFCIDRDNNPHPPTAENILSKTKLEIGLSKFQDEVELEMNELITHAEIRRLYKLSVDENIDIEIRQAAKDTVKFIKLEGDLQSVNLRQVSAPWEGEMALSWMQEWQLRKSLSKPIQKNNSWRGQLKTWVTAVRATERPKKLASVMRKLTVPLAIQPKLQLQPAINFSSLLKIAGIVLVGKLAERFLPFKIPLFQ